MSDDESRSTVHDSTSRKGTFGSEYTIARGGHAATAKVTMPNTIEGPKPVSSLTGRVWDFDNPDYEAFPPEEGGQGVIFHRTRPNISGWYGTGNSMLDAEALSGAVQQSIKHTGMFPRRDSVLSPDSGAAVANFIDKPEIKDSSDFLEGVDRRAYAASIARTNASVNNSRLGSESSITNSKGTLRDATDEEQAAAKGALRELPKYKKIYKAMEDGQQWDPNSVSAFRDRANKNVAEPKPKKAKVNPNQLELDL